MTYKDLKFYIKNYFWSTPYLVLFNFRYLPFKQAIKLPIWINSHNWKMGGTITIQSDRVFCGMIRLGYENQFYHSKGIYYQNRGHLFFNGPANIGNNSVIRIWNGGSLIFGENFGASTTRFLCNDHIEFGNNVRVGMDSVFLDSNMHKVFSIKKNQLVNECAPIFIGNNNWFGYHSLVLKGTRTPDNIIISACAILNKKYDVPQNSIIGNKVSAELISEGYMPESAFNNR